MRLRSKQTAGHNQDRTPESGGGGTAAERASFQAPEPSPTWRKFTYAAIAGVTLAFGGCAQPKPPTKEDAISLITKGYEFKGNSTDGFGLGGPSYQTRYKSLADYPQFANDREVVAAAVSKHGVEQLEHASPELRANREFMAQMIAINGNAFLYLDAALKKDVALATLAASKTPQVVPRLLPEHQRLLAKDAVSSPRRFYDGAKIYQALHADARASIDVILATLKPLDPEDQNKRVLSDFYQAVPVDRLSATDLSSLAKQAAAMYHGLVTEAVPESVRTHPEFLREHLSVLEKIKKELERKAKADAKPLDDEIDSVRDKLKK